MSVYVAAGDIIRPRKAEARLANDTRRMAVIKCVVRQDTVTHYRRYACPRMRTKNPV